MYSQWCILLAYSLACAFLGIVNAACPTDWEEYGGRCFLFVDHKTDSWIGAARSCDMLGGTLAELQDPYTAEWVSYRAMQIYRGIWWIGLNDIESQGVWLWYGSRSLASHYYTNWKGGKPALQRKKNCAGFNSAGSWAHYKCRNERRYICQAL